jgi:hypothetical protein
MWVVRQTVNHDPKRMFQYCRPFSSAHVAVKAAVNPKCDSTVFEMNLKECRATLP